MVSHAFTCWVLVCFLSHVIIFAIGERTNEVSEGCSEKLYKIIQKIVVMEYFHSKLADLQATDSCRDGWNVRNGSKILHSVGENVDCVLLLALVLLLSKHNYVILFWAKSITSVLLQKVHKSVDVIMKKGLKSSLKVSKISS